jgi:hypothetical protein
MGFIGELRRFLCLLPTLVGFGPIFRCIIHSTDLYFTLSSPLAAGRKAVSDGALCAHRHRSASTKPVAMSIGAAERESRIWKGEGNSLRRASGDECGDNAIGE